MITKKKKSIKNITRNHATLVPNPTKKSNEKDQETNSNQRRKKSTERESIHHNPVTGLFRKNLTKKHTNIQEGLRVVKVNRSTGERTRSITSITGNDLLFL